MSLFQSDLRKQIRNLPKILNFVKIIHYYSKLFTGVLRQHRPGLTGDGLSGDEVEELLCEAASLQIIVDDGRLDYIEFVRVLMAK